MIIRVTTFIDIDVKDREQGEDACSQLVLGLDSALSGFPRESGEILGTDVDTFRELTPEEIAAAEYGEEDE